MDLSYSMRDDLVNLQNLGSQLGEERGRREGRGFEIAEGEREVLWLQDENGG